MDSGHGQRLVSSSDFNSASLIQCEDVQSHGKLSIDSIPIYMKELIAGGAAGGFAKTVVAPLERVKILYQTQYDKFQSLGVRRSLQCIYRNEGVFGLYRPVSSLSGQCLDQRGPYFVDSCSKCRGNGASVIRVVPYAALHFMAYEQYRRWFIQHWPSSAPSGAVVDLLAGSLAGGTAVICTYPLDLARTMLAYQVKDVVGGTSFTGIGDVFYKIFKANGFRGLYRGVGPTLYGMLPYAGLKFFIYEKLKGTLPDEVQGTVSSKLACGAVAGMVGQTLTYPLDVVRRQMQVQMVVSSKHGEYRNTVDGLVYIARMHGVKQLFAGLSINYFKLVPSVAIGFATYDSLKSLLRVPPRERGQEKAKRL